KEYKNETTFKKVVEVFKMRDRLEVKMYRKNSDLSIMRKSYLLADLERVVVIEVYCGYYLLY
ncbi:hypothetical protein C2G38_2092158, partial [Gigaspora rosea]